MTHMHSWEMCVQQNYTLRIIDLMGKVDHSKHIGWYNQNTNKNNDPNKNTSTTKS